MEVPTKLVYIRFRPIWTYLDGVREFCRFFCATTFASDDVAERMQLVIQEALENAVRYARSEAPDLEISIETDGKQIILAVESEPDARHLHRLWQEIDYMRTTSAEAGFQQALVRATESWDAGPPGLGLARMRFEGHMGLSVEELGKGRVRFIARGDL